MRARAPIQERNTAPIAPHNCSERSSGNGSAEHLLHLRLVEIGDALPVGGIEIGVELDALVLFLVVEDFLEMAVIHLEHDAGIHLDEAAIGIVSEALVAGELGEALDGLGIETEIEDGVHHARHRGARAGAHETSSGRLAIAEAGVRQLADARESGFDGRLEIGRIGLAVLVIMGADLGGDGEARRHRQAEIAHLGEIGALAAQERAHLRICRRPYPRRNCRPISSLSPFPHAPKLEAHCHRHTNHLAEPSMQACWPCGLFALSIVRSFEFGKNPPARFRP